MAQDRTDHIADSPFDDVLTMPIRIASAADPADGLQVPTQRTGGRALPAPELLETPDSVPPPQVNGVATAGLVVGIVAAVIAFIPFAGTVSWVLAPIALVLSVVGLVRSDRAGSGRKTSIAGIVLAVVALVVCIVYTALLIGVVHYVDAGSGPVNHTTTYAVTTPH